MKKTFVHIALLIGLNSLLISCASHTLRFPSSYFVTPYVSDDQWSGHVAATLSEPAKVELINDIDTNPPRRDKIELNQDDIRNLILFGYGGLSASLVVWPKLSIDIKNDVTQIKWQFLNPRAKNNQWVASAVIGGSSSKVTTERNGTSKAETTITGSQLGLSVGYLTAKAIPYISILQNEYNTRTDVHNTHGDFGPYKENGKHLIGSIGVVSYGKGFYSGIEYSVTDMSWNQAKDTHQNLGLLLGYAW